MSFQKEPNNKNQQITVNNSSIDTIKTLLETIAKLKTPYMDANDTLQYGTLFGRYWTLGNISDPSIFKEKVTEVEDTINNHINDNAFPSELEKFEPRILEIIKTGVPYYTYIPWNYGQTFQEWVSNDESRKKSKIPENDLKNLLQSKKNEALQCWEKGKAELKGYLEKLKSETDLYLSQQNTSPQFKL